MAPAVFKLPLDAYVLAIPCLYACGAFTWMSLRPWTVDPDKSTLEYYNDEKVAAKQGQYYDNQFKGFFAERIKNKSFGIFNNNLSSQ
ncbi:hypothetical protein HYH03_015888 [Edaphochlamys debaryana]|uniref:Uncharacterized protein n=1 Tax=Edaphochlamys debaryana TaxID=47281 RepID=A0A835XIM7_9CHLO|nr:hypothetical protein HYH03_015888 [Edaphochlamys debaryana]|eukprot:KAG2485402.1 hypothetical protein HYH03_015888 [Edaphochlamys debaryana]